MGIWRRKPHSGDSTSDVRYVFVCDEWKRCAHAFGSGERRTVGEVKRN